MNIQFRSVEPTPYLPHGPQLGSTAYRPHAQRQHDHIQREGPVLRYSGIDDHARTVTHGAPSRFMRQAGGTKISSFMRSSADRRNRPARRPASASTSGRGSSSAGRYSAPQYYSVAARSQPGAQSRASAAFDTACASACAAACEYAGSVAFSEASASAASAAQNQRGSPPLGYISPRAVSPFGKANSSTRPEAMSACVARGGPDGGMVSAATNQYLILNEMAAAANEAQLEAARQQEEARLHAIHAGAAERLSVQQHVEAQQAAVAAAADGNPTSPPHAPPPPSTIGAGTGLGPGPPSPVPAPPNGGAPGNSYVSHRGLITEIRPPSRSRGATTVCLGTASSSPSRSPGPHRGTGGWSPGGRGDGSPMRTASPTFTEHSYSTCYPGSPSGGGIRASQLVTAPQTLVHYHGSATLRRSLDIALLDSSRAREECVCAVQEVMEELGRHVWPNQSSGLAARALVVRLSRSAARLRAAAERLEKESDVAHHAHKAELDSAFHRYAYTHGCERARD